MPAAISVLRYSRRSKHINYACVQGAMESQRREEGNLGDGEALAAPDCPGALSLTLFFRPGSLLSMILAAAQLPLFLPICPGQYPRSPRDQILHPMDSPHSCLVPTVHLLNQIPLRLASASHSESAASTPRSRPPSAGQPQVPFAQGNLSLHCCSGITINRAPFHSQKWLSLDNKF